MSSHAESAAWFRAAIDHHRAGRLDEAAPLYRRVIASDHRHADATHYLGLLLSQQNHFAEALELMRRSVMLSPARAHYHANLAETLRRSGQLEAAIDAARRGVQLSPNDAEALYNLGVALADSRQLAEAGQVLQRVVTIRPNHHKAWNNFANVLAQLGRISESLSAFERAAALASGSTNDLSDILSNWSLALLEADQPDEALAKAHRAAELSPQSALAHCNVGRCACSFFDLSAAINSYRRALEIQPDYWLAHSNLLFTLLHHPDTTDQGLLEEHRDWGQRHALAEQLPQRTPVAADRNRPIRIGYVSPDFRQHPVAFFIEPVLAHYGQEFEIVCYSNATLAEADEITERIKSYGHGWREIAGLADARVASLIRDADRIDILVDLSGHTTNNRLRLFGLKPAPVQVSYLGYQATSGVEAIDFRFTDALVDPPGMTDAFYVERLVRLETFACYRPPDEAPPVAGRPDFKPGHITFGAFTKIEKISGPTLDLWAATMNRLADSRLIVFASAFSERSIANRFRELIAQRGIDIKRVQTVGRQSFSDYLASHQRVDLVLDTVTFNGHTTTCHALWMGVPTLTLAGGRYASRMGLAVMTHLGLTDFVAQTQDEFTAQASQLAANPERLASLRQSMRARMRESILMDEGRFTRSLETAYREVWTSWCDGRSSKWGCPAK